MHMFNQVLRVRQGAAVSFLCYAAGQLVSFAKGVQSSCRFSRSRSCQRNLFSLDTATPTVGKCQTVMQVAVMVPVVNKLTVLKQLFSLAKAGAPGMEKEYFKLKKLLWQNILGNQHPSDLPRAGKPFVASRKQNPLLKRLPLSTSGERMRVNTPNYYTTEEHDPNL